MLISFINNISLLLALSICHSFILKRWKPDTLPYQITSGILFGCITIAGMMNPFVMTEGIIFDGRSFVASIAGLMGGSITAIIVVLIGGAYRIWGIGGGGALMGVCVLSTSAGLGALYRYWRSDKPEFITPLYLYCFGVIVHITMILWMFTLPADKVWMAISNISIPVMIIFPICTVVLGKMLYEQIISLSMQIDLEKSEEKYRELVEHANSIILRLDIAGNIKFFNEYAQKFFGYSEDEIIGRSIIGTIVPETESTGRDLSKIAEQITNNPDKYSVNENENIRKNGELVWISWTNKVIVDENNQPTELLCIGNDITEHRQAEESLRKSEQQYKILAENVTDVIWTADMNLRYTYISPSIKQLIGFTVEEHISKTIEQMITPASYDYAMKVFAEELAIEATENKDLHRSRTLEIEQFCKDGSTIWTEEKLVFLRDESDQAVGILGVARDITELKRAETYRQLSSEVLSILNESAGLHEAIQRVLEAINLVTNCDAVGIRLKSEEDFPYFVQHGFSNDFLLTENTLLVRDPQGGICRGPDGKVSLECTCGLVISGKTDPSNPSCTPRGSFWTNDSFPLLDLPESDDPRIHPRNQCIHEGYGSVALIPIHGDQQIVGILQLNAFRKNCFSFDAIQSLETIAGHLAVALMRKQAEEALRIEKQLSEDYINSMPGLFYVFDEKRFIRWNKEWEKVTGYSNEELAVRYGTDFFEGEDRELIEERMLKVLHEGAAEAEAELVTKHGIRIPYYFNGLRKEFDGKPYIVGLGIDITERKRTEAQLKMQALVLDQIDEHITITDLSGVITYVNNAQSRILGESMDKFIGETTNIYGEDPEQGATQKEILENTLRDGSWRGEVVNLTYDGRKVVMDCRTQVVRNEYGKAIYLCGIASDITERKQTDEALRNSEEKFRTIAETSPLAIYMSVGIEQKAEYINPTFIKLFGYTLEDAPTVADWWPKAYPDETYRRQIVAEWQRKVEKAIETKSEIEPMEVVVTCKDGSKKNISWGFISIGKQNWAFGLDLTDRKRAEEELLKARKLESVGILAGGIAHDFNNLLMAIVGNISLAKALSDSPEKINECLYEAEKATNRAQNLTQQLLTFSKGGAPVKESANVVDLVKETAAFSLRGSNVTYDFDFPDNLWQVEVDKGQFSQVIQNLVINADQAMPEGGTIYIKGENIAISYKDEKHDSSLQEGDYVKLSIKDQGTGIPKDHLQKIFDPYFTTKQKGSGLGLATTYSIIKNHQGDITVESQIGAGTTFTIHLPRSFKESLATQETVQEELLTDQGRILIMDDEKMIRDVAGMMLEHIGYEVDFAEDGYKAIEKYLDALESGNGFNAVIMDLTIPGGMGGKEAIQKLLAIDPQVKAVVSSGYSNDPIMADYKKYGFCGVISKPYVIEDLAVTLQNVIHK